MTRALVTGVGAITPIGLTAHDYWKNLLAGESGIGPITRFDASNLPVRIAGEVKDFEAGHYMDHKTARRMSRFAQFSVAAAQIAVDDAKLTIADSERSRAATSVATGGGGLIDTADEMLVLLDKGPGRVSPFFVPTMAPNMASCQVAMHLGLRGPALTSVAACAAGLYAYIEAKMLIDSGRADIVLAGGTEAALHPLPIAALANMKALSRRNDEPTRASRP
ncbi:MAG: beta-ketoacyl synthase N-terminal-like domain-containing protein, partial [Tepidiformaceae bacterium]